MASNEEVDMQQTDGLTMDHTAHGGGVAERAGNYGELWRNRRRSSRKRTVNARSIDVRRIAKSELELGRVMYREVDVDRPVTRADCAEGARPCLFISCKHHLYLDVSPRTGSIKLNFPDLEVDEMAETCVLDVADRGGTAIEDVGTIMNLTRERVRQVEVQALADIAAMEGKRGLQGWGDDGPVRKRRLPVFVEEESDEEEEVPASEPDVFEPDMVSADAE
jgi:hypothetical protein